MPDLRHIVVGVDGSANAHRALEWAVGLARPVGARVTAVHALGLLDRIGATRVPAAANRDAIVEEFCTRWCAPLDTAGVEHERVVLDGPPADVILAAAAERGADLVVVGERGTGGQGGTSGSVTLGSTSRRVIEGSDRPVLVVPEPGPGS